MDAKTKVRVNRLRRIASRQGLRLEKSRQRNPMALDYGKYSLVSGRPGHIHIFIGQGDLDQVEDWLGSGHRLIFREDLEQRHYLSPLPHGHWSPSRPNSNL